MPRKVTPKPKAKAMATKPVKKPVAKKPDSRPQKTSPAKTPSKLAPSKPKDSPRKRPAKSYEREINQLLEQGKKEGKLDQRDIFSLIPDTPANIDLLEQFYAEL